VTQTKKKLSAPTAASPEVSSDVNKETGAEERFKEINRAYEVLSEPEIRSRDRFGEAGSWVGFQDIGDMGGFADIF